MLLSFLKLRKTRWIKSCEKVEICERRINIAIVYKICERENHCVFLPERERERELNIVPEKYSSGIYPELISMETY